MSAASCRFSNTPLRFLEARDLHDELQYLVDDRLVGLIAFPHWRHFLPGIDSYLCLPNRHPFNPFHLNDPETTQTLRRSEPHLMVALDRKLEPIMEHDHVAANITHHVETLTRKSPTVKAGPFLELAER